MHRLFSDMAASACTLKFGVVWESDCLGFLCLGYGWPPGQARRHLVKGSSQKEGWLRAVGTVVKGIKMKCLYYQYSDDLFLKAVAIHLSK